MQYRREIDGIRAAAILPVILFHAGLESWKGGFVGVDVFFVLSGYLITSIILAELETNSFSIVKFYERRARRILPALCFVIVVCCLPLAWLLFLPSDLESFSKSLVSVSVFASNFFFWSESGYFDRASELKPLLHTWSLAVEEQYYVLFPLFLAFFWRLGRKKTLSALAALFCLSLVGAEMGALCKPELAFFLLPTRAWELLVGSFVAFHLSSKKSASFEWRLGRINVGGVLDSLGLFLIVYAVATFDSETIPFPGLYAIIPTFGTALVVLFSSPQTVVGKILGSRLFVGIGLISYSAYLWHFPLFVFAKYHQDGTLGFLQVVSLSFLSLALAWLSWKYVEAPFRDPRRINRRQIFGASFVGLAFLCAAGFLGVFVNGYEARYSGEDKNLASFDKAEAIAYVTKTFNAHILRNFDLKDSRKKVLIIGDSYAQDVVNALYEAGLSSQIQLSTFHVEKNCGNIYTTDDLTPHISLKHRFFCRLKGGLTHPKLKTLLKEADIVLLVSSWQPWQVDFIPVSLRNLELDFGKKFLVFGRKSFGPFSMRDLLALHGEQRYETKLEIPKELSDVNARMKASLPAESFVDLSLLLCPNDRECPLFTDERALVTFDSGHLTREGARVLGKKLSQNPLLQGRLF